MEVQLARKQWAIFVASMGGCLGLNIDYGWEWAIIKSVGSI